MDYSYAMRMATDPYHSPYGKDSISPMHGKIKGSFLGAESEGRLARIPIIGRGGAHSVAFQSYKFRLEWWGVSAPGLSPPCRGTDIQKNCP